jgi:hypothetical protein
MKSFLKFGCAFVGGALFVLLILYLFYLRTNSSDTEELSFVVQYIEVKGRQGDVILHTGMPKDSVRMLVGKPNSIDMNSSIWGVFEGWDYNIRNGSMPDLEINFINGVLTSVRQN